MEQISIGMALLGCDVVSTDQTEVLPLLMRNVERNTSRIMQTISDPGFKLICHSDLFSFLNCIISYHLSYFCMQTDLCPIVVVFDYDLTESSIPCRFIWFHTGSRVGLG